MRGRRVILVFYPADWEPVSQHQLILYQEFLADFELREGALFGISTDQLWSHQAFARAMRIYYPLLADAHPKGAVAQAYGVYDDEVGLSGRALFVLDEEGIVRWSAVSPTAINPGVDGIFTALESLASPRAAHERTAHD
jgi:peroxiredoxin